VIGSAAILLAGSIVFSGVQPQLAAIGKDVYLVFGRGDSIQVSRSTDAADTFGELISLPTSGKLALGMRRGPRVAATGGAVLVAAVMGQLGGGANGDVLLFRSTDRGKTWARPVPINDVPGSAGEGMHAMAASPTGVVAIAWLDLRERGTRIYAAISRDHGATWSKDLLLYSSPSGSVCECCHPSVAVDERGRIAVMFRNQIEGNRDMFVVRSSDGRTFTAAGQLGTQSWALNACPMDGGGVALGDDGLVAVWRRGADIFSSTDTIPERRLASGREAVVAELGQHRDLAWAAPAGVELMRGSAAPIPIGVGRFPVVLALETTNVVAWEDKGSITLRTIPR